MCSRFASVSATDLQSIASHSKYNTTLFAIVTLRWSKQIALEVHDVDGRLAATVELLRSDPAAFDEVCWESQGTSEVLGYVMVVPEALRMFMVFAKRRPKTQPTMPRVPDSGNDSSSSQSPGDQEAEVAGSSRTAPERGGDRREHVGMGPRFCACAAGDR